MKYIKIIIVIALILLAAIIISLQTISQKEFKGSSLKNKLKTDSLVLDADELLKTLKPIMGYRFVLFGDFNGDKKVDTLVERFTDSTGQFEAPKYHESQDTNFDYEEEVFLISHLKNKSFLEWKNLNVSLEGGQLGFHYMENCGDVNMDGKDEILVLRQWADWSNLNTAYIYCFDGEKWEEIYKIHVWEWQFPPTPEVSMIPGPFGNFQIGHTQNDSLDQEIRKYIKSYRFIKHYSDNSIEFSGMNPFNLYDDSLEMKEYEEIGDQAYLEKHFTQIYLNDSLYLRSRENPSLYYKIDEPEDIDNKNIIIFCIDDPASMFTTRIFTKHFLSPLRKKKKK